MAPKQQGEEKMSSTTPTFNHQETSATTLTEATERPTTTFADNRSVAFELDIDKTSHSTMDGRAKDSLFLRWSRISKKVAIKESNSGLLRTSIAAPTTSTSRKSFQKPGTTEKSILDCVSGCAAPGEVLAMMG
jgi:hypothetical protein